MSKVNVSFYVKYSNDKEKDIWMWRGLHFIFSDAILRTYSRNINDAERLL